MTILILTVKMLLGDATIMSPKRVANTLNHKKRRAMIASYLLEKPSEILRPCGKRLKMNATLTMLLRLMIFDLNLLPSR